ncbi:hypothetical protein [Vibrio crassostreae]|nr:hypothetical protein [Vibrio crassostreae]
MLSSFFDLVGNTEIKKIMVGLFADLALLGAVFGVITTSFMWG